ncbi:MAG: HIT domain-containing protein [archaeon]|nr:HIT domain-containing protein [archaeon]
MTTKQHTIFDKIIRKKVAAFIIYETKENIAFFDRKPVCGGHTLVVPKKAYKSLFDIPEKELKSLILAVKDVAEILKKKLGAEGINILHASEEVAQQSVLHFHFHLIPRKKGDNLDMWPKVDYKEIDLKKVFSKF